MSSKYFIIEADTNYHSLFAIEVERFYVPEAKEFRFRKIIGGICICDADRPQFFGSLSSLLPSASTIPAPPMELAEPNLPKNRVDQAIAEAEQAVDRVSE